MLIEDASPPPSSTVCDSGCFLQSDMSMTTHVNQIIGRCFRQLRLIISCVKSLSFQVARAVVDSFIISNVHKESDSITGYRGPVQIINQNLTPSSAFLYSLAECVAVSRTRFQRA
jgi:hypothetical protein